MAGRYRSQGNFLGENLESYFKVDKKDDDSKLEWLNTVMQALLSESVDRTEAQRKFLKGYLGRDSRDYLEHRDTYDTEYRRRRRVKKFRIPHIYDIVETKVSQMNRLRPDIDVLPAHDEYSDRGAAKVAKAVVRNIFEQQNLDELSACLLYTSPSPRDQRGSRMPSSA